MILDAEPNNLMELLRGRRSVRAYLPTTVEKETIEKILDMARHTASGGNMQPWRVHVLFQETIAELYGEITNDITKNGFAAKGDYQYYPSGIEQLYKERVNLSAQDLYKSLGIGSRDTQRKREQKIKNFDFYGAPVGLIVTMNRNLAQGSWIDIGMFLNTISLAIAQCGLGCCLQASFSSYGDTVRKVLKLAPENLIICGVALGHEDRSNPINTLPKRRVTVDEFVEFHP